MTNPPRLRTVFSDKQELFFLLSLLVLLSCSLQTGLGEREGTVPFLKERDPKNFQIAYAMYEAPQSSGLWVGFF